MALFKPMRATPATVNTISLEDGQMIFVVGDDSADIYLDVAMDSENVIRKQFKGSVDENIGTLDFDALKSALTGGTLTGISIVQNGDEENFNITVGNLANLSISDDGYWVIDGTTTTQLARGPQGEQGIQGEQGAKGDKGDTGDKGEKGIDGLTPYIDTITHNWYIGDNDTGVLAEGTSSYTHIKYSPIEPTQNSDMTDTADAWIGFYSGDSETAPENYTDYTWYKIKGEDGITTVSATAVNLTGTLSAGGWSDNAPYSQTISVTGLTDSNPIIDIILSDDSDTAEQEDTEWGYINKAVASTNSLTVICLKNKPTIDLNIQIKVV